MAAGGGSALRPWAYLLIKPMGDAPVDLPTATKSDLVTQEHRIGRSPVCNTIMEGYSVVSANHCTITTNFETVPVSSGPKGFYYLKATITDTSTNGTLVNGRLLRKGDSCELPNDARIEMKGKKLPIYLEFHLEALAEGEIQELKQRLRSLPPSSAASPSPTKIVAVQLERTPTNDGQTEASGQKRPLPSHQTGTAVLPPPVFSPSASASSSENELNFLRKRVKELESKLVRQEHMRLEADKLSVQEKEKLQAIISKLHEETGRANRDLASTTGDLQTRLNETVREYELLRGEHDALRTKMKKIEMQHAAETEKRMAELSEAKQTLLTVRDSLTKQLEQEKHEVIKLKVDLKEKEANLSEEQATSGNLREQFREAESKLAESQREIESKKVQIDTLTQQHHAEVLVLQQKIAGHEKAMGGIKTFYEQSQLQLQHTIQVLNANVMQLQERDRAYQRTVAEFASKMEATEISKNDLVRQLETTRKDADDLRTLLERTKAELDGEKMESLKLLKQRQEENELLRSECEARQTTITGLKSKLSSEQSRWESEIRRLEQQDSDHRKRTQTVEGEMSRLQLRFETERARWMSSSARMGDLVHGLEDVLTKSVLDKLSKLKQISLESSSSSSSSTKSMTKPHHVDIPATEPADDDEHVVSETSKLNRTPDPNSSSASKKRRPDSIHSERSKRSALAVTQRDDHDDVDDAQSHTGCLDDAETEDEADRASEDGDTVPDAKLDDENGGQDEEEEEGVVEPGAQRQSEEDSSTAFTTQQEPHPQPSGLVRGTAEDDRLTQASATQAGDAPVVLAAQRLSNGNSQRSGKERDSSSSFYDDMS